MKKNTLSILFILLSLNYSQAQTHKRDSLKALIKTEKRDTQKVNLLCALAYAYVTIKPDTAIKIALEALTLANRSHFIKGQALSLNRIGHSFDISGNYAKSMEAYLQALKLNESINRLSGMAQSNNNLGVLYRDMGDFERALAYDRKAKKLYETVGIKNGVAICLANLGSCYSLLKQYDSARVYTQLGYEAFKKHIPKRLGEPLLIQGEIYSKMNESKLALEYYRLSLPYLERIEDNADISTVFLDMAKEFEIERVPDSAFFYAKKAFYVSHAIGKYNQQVADAANFLVAFYDKKKLADSTVFYFKVATAAKDSLYSQQRYSQLQSLGFDEQLRQIELANTDQMAEEERKRNLQFAGIAIGIFTFLVLFFALSRSVVVKERFIKYFGVFMLLAVFEFINLLIHPYLAKVTNDSPLVMLMILIGIGSLLVPLHHQLE
ncbi:tetratricopeptide repeat protein, partial [uncultured Mucilaginibacter sp.]